MFNVNVNTFNLHFIIKRERERERERDVHKIANNQIYFTQKVIKLFVQVLFSDCRLLSKEDFSIFQPVSVMNVWPFHNLISNVYIVITILFM